MSEVYLFVYDLSSGMAKQMSRSIIGKQIDGIWHTGVHVYGSEFFFGGGICEAPPKTTPYGTPVREIKMGPTEVPEEMFRDYLHDISSEYTFQTYDIFKHNCNHFSNDVCQFLLGQSIPEDILNLPQEALNTPFGTLNHY